MPTILGSTQNTVHNLTTLLAPKTRVNLDLNLNK